MAESKSGAAKPIRELKPGWLSRIFGIETGTLQGVMRGLQGEGRDIAFAVAQGERGDRIFVALGVSGSPIIQIEKSQLLFRSTLHIKSNDVDITLTVDPGYNGPGLQGRFVNHHNNRRGRWRTW